MSILQLLYNLFNWQYFGIVAIIWIVVDFVWVGRWKALIGRLGLLIKKPWIFEKDEEADEPPLYPRRFLEQLALNSRREDKTVAQSNTKGDTKSVTKSTTTIASKHDPANASTSEGTLATTMTKWGNAQRDRVFDADYPLRSLGYVIALGFFIFFLIADTITIANTLVLMGVISPNLPPILQRLDLAILGGALLTAVVGVWMLVELSGEGELINTKLTPEQKRILKLFAVTVTLFATLVMLALAIQRLISLGFLQSTPTMDIILSFILYGILAINNSLSAALTFQPAASGLVVVIYLLVIIIVGILPVLAFLADVIGRAVYIAVDAIMWLVFTPIIAIPYGIGKIFGLFN